MRKLFSTLLLISFIVGLSGSALATAGPFAVDSESFLNEAVAQRTTKVQAEGFFVGEKYTYTAASGESQEYYLDEDYNTYCITADGEREPVLIPLPCFEITDARLLAGLFPNVFPDLGRFPRITPFALPANPINLSSPYEETAAFGSARELAFYVPNSYPSIKLQTTNYTFSGSSSNKKMIIAILVYSEQTGTADHSYLLNGVDFSSKKVLIGGLMSATRYVAVTIYPQSASLTSCKLNFSASL